MSSLQSQNVVARSATTTPPPQARAHVPEVAKLIDVSKCIGCKACQVACMEWNDLRDDVGSNIGVYDNPSDLTSQSWTLMRFFEVEPEPDKLEWLIRKDGCMHCDDPGCLKACPSPGAIVKYANGIVDFISEHCIGCGYCIKGCPFNVPRIYGSATRVGQVLLNLVLNALQALPDRPIERNEVKLSLDERDGRAIVEVADNGVGIEPGNLSHIFDPFFTTKKKGTGLGLAISKQIVEEMGGQIQVESRPGQGTRFRISWPLLTT